MVYDGYMAMRRGGVFVQANLLGGYHPNNDVREMTSVIWCTCWNKIS